MSYRRREETRVIPREKPPQPAPKERVFSGVLWDLDGTIVDTEPYWVQAEHDLMSRYGLSWTSRQALQMVGNPLTTSAMILREHGLPMETEQIVQTLLRSVRAQLHRHVPFRPGAAELLEELRIAGIPSALVTMSYRSLAEAVVDYLPPGTFTAVVTGDEVPIGKPDPAPFRLGAQRLGYPPRSCVAIEDSVPGLESAERAGTLAIGVPHMVPLEPHPQRLLISTLEGVTVEQLNHLARQKAVLLQ